MRQRLARTPDTLDVARLPRNPATELNFRLPTGSRAQDSLVVARRLTWALVFLGPCTCLLGLLGPILGKYAIILGGCFVAWFALVSVWRFTSSQPIGPSLSMVAIGLLDIGVVLLLQYVPNLTVAYLALFLPSLIAAVWLAECIAHQSAAWMAANPRVERQYVRQWQGFWNNLWDGPIPVDCPEILTVRVSLGTLSVLAFFGYAVMQAVSKTSQAGYAGLAGLVSLLVPLPFLWLLWNLSGFVRPLPLSTTLQATWKAFQVWFNYNTRQIPAPGLFQFPTAIFRSPLARDLAFSGVVILLAVASLSLSPYAGVDPRIKASATLPAVPADYAQRILPGELQTLQQLPVAVQAGYRQQIVKQRQTEITNYQQALAQHGRREPVRWSADLFVSAFVCLVLSTFGPLALCWFVFGSLLARYYLALEAPQGYAQSENSVWDIAVNRLLCSKDQLEREHILMGTSLYGGYPVLLHRKLLNQHAHLTGDTGAGKSSLGIAPTMSQLIAAEKCSVVVLDLKGDMALFETARVEAQADGRPFKWFTNVAGHSSYIFNPFQQAHVPHLTSNQRTQTILQALGLDFGTAYGASFYSAINEIVLLNFIRQFKITSFRELHTILSDKNAYRAAGNSDEDWKNSRHLAALVDRLASIGPLNATPVDVPDRPAAIAQQIDMGDTLRREQVNYFFLSSPEEPNSAAAIAKLVLYALFTAAARRAPDQTQQVYIFVDEFQRIVSDSIKLVLEQARALKLAFIIVHQTVGQLKAQGVDVLQTVEACTAVKQVFRASSPEVAKRLVETSGMALYETATWQQVISPSTFDDRRDDGLNILQARDGLVSVVETPGPRLERNTVIEISAHPQASIVRFTEGSGYTQFSGYSTPILTEFHITSEEYKTRSDATWPNPTPATLRTVLE